MTQHFNVVLIVQARMGATRLPGKVLLEILHRPMLSYLMQRLMRCRLVKEIVVATTKSERDRPIVDFCHFNSFPFFQGSELDVLDRYYQAAKRSHADVVVRVTADCPLIDPTVVDRAISFYLDHYPHYDYVSNVIPRTYPRGMDVEVISFKALEEAALTAQTPWQREHVTPYIHEHPERFECGSLIRTPDTSHLRWTVDTPEDFALISEILQTVYPNNPNFTLEDLLFALQEHPEWLKINAHVQQKPIR